MTQLKATANLVLDIAPVAQAIAIYASDALPLPKIGLYEKGTPEPILAPGKNYYTIRRTGKMLTNKKTKAQYEEVLQEPVAWNDKFNSDVYDEDGKIVARATLRFNYSFAPDTSAVSRALVVGILEHVIERHSNIYPTQHKSVQDVILSFLRPELQELHKRFQVQNNWIPSWEEEKAMEALDFLFDTIGAEVLEIETNLLQFLDKDHWFVFILKEVNGDVLITRTHDYRIICWEKEHGENFRKTCGKRIR